MYTRATDFVKLNDKPERLTDFIGYQFGSVVINIIDKLLSVRIVKEDVSAQVLSFLKLSQSK